MLKTHPAPRVISVSEWGGKRVDNRRLSLLTAKGLVIHHTASSNRRAYPEDNVHESVIAFQVARSIQRFHMHDRGWRDSAQHFTVSRGGLILEGRTGSLEAAKRGLVLAGAHSGKHEQNTRWWGIEVEGTYTEEEPTFEQWDALTRLAAWLSLSGRTQAAAIEGHRAYRKTKCPGDVLFHMLPRLILEVRALKLHALTEQ